MRQGAVQWSQFLRRFSLPAMVEMPNGDIYIYIYVCILYIIYIYIPSGYLLHSHGESPFLIGKPSINEQFSMAMLNNQRVYIYI